MLLVLKSNRTEPAKKAAISAELVELWKLSNPDTARHYGYMGIRLGSATRNPEAYYHPVSNLAALYRENGRYDSSYHYLYVALDTIRSWGDSVYVAHILKDLGILSRRELQFDKGIEQTLRSLNLLRQYAPNAYGWETIVLISLGRLYDEKGNYARAVDAFESAHALADAHRDDVPRKQRGMALYFLGTAHLRQGMLLDAEAAMARYDSFSRERKDYTRVYEAGNHGALALFLRDTALAFKYHRNSLAYGRNMQDSKRRAVASGNLAELYLSIGKYQDAINHAHESIDFSGQDLEILNFSLKTMHQAQAGLGRSDSAYKYLVQYNELHDSMLMDQQTARIDQLEVAFRTREQEQQLALQEVQLAKGRAARTQLLMLLGLAVLALVLLYLLLRQRARYAEQLAQHRGNLLDQQEREHQRDRELGRIKAMLDGQEAERKRIAQDLHDGLGGLLASIKAHFTSHFDGQGLSRHDPYAKGVEMLDKAYAEVRQIAHSLMPQALSMSSLSEAVEDLLGILEAQGIAVDYEIIGPVNEVLNEQESVTVYRILQELVANTLRHAKAGSVIVQILADQDRLSLVFEDDGEGFDVHAVSSAGLGMSSLRSRVDLLGGEIDLSSSPGEGTSVTVSIPIRQSSIA